MADEPPIPAMRGGTGVTPTPSRIGDYNPSAAFEAAGERDNLLAATLRAVSPDGDYGFDQTWNGPKFIRGTKYEPYSERFVGSPNQMDTGAIMARIDREEQNNQTIDRAGGAGVIASMIVGTMDPTILMPAGTIYRSLRGGQAALRSGISVGIAGGGQVAIQETALQALQETRPFSESAINVGSATLLAGLIGAGASRFLKPAEITSGVRSLDEARAKLDVHASSALGGADNVVPFPQRTAGTAATVDGEAPAAVAASVGAAATDTRQLSPVSYGLDKIPGVGKFISKWFPTLDALTNGDVVTRRTVAELATFPGRVTENLTGGTTTRAGGPAIDLEIKMQQDGLQAAHGDEANRLWTQYRTRDVDPATLGTMDTAQRLMGRAPEGKLSFDEFDAAVYDALSTGDTHAIPEVTQMAQWIRRNELDPIGTRATAIDGFEHTKLREGETYAPRMWNQDLIRSKWKEFVDDWTGWLHSEQTVKAAAQKRIAALHDELTGIRARMEKRVSEDDFVTASALHDDVRTKLENEIAAWDGKSAGEAKSAIKAREKYAADTAREADASRLESADAAIERVAKRIIESKRDLDIQELRSRAQEIASRHIGTPEGRLPYDMDMGGPQIGLRSADDLRGHAAGREVDLPYEISQKWLDRSASRALHSYRRTVLADAVIAERMGGDPNMLAVFKEIESAYAARLDGAKTEKESKRLLAQRDTDMRIVAGIRDRIRGTFGWDPDMKNLARVSQGALKINNIVSSHAMAVSSLPDFAGAIFRHGLESAFSDGWNPFLSAMTDAKAWEAWKKSGNEWKAFGIGIETKTASRQHAIDEINESYRPASRFERALSWASDKSFIINLLSLETDLQKRIAANVASHNILRATRALSEGKATKAQIALLGESNITPALAERIWKQFDNAGGADVQGVLLPNLGDWADDSARLAFAGAVTRDVNIAVVTPGQEKPFWMSRQGWNVFGQYKAFTASATMRIMIANLQRADAATMQGLIASVGMGVLSYRINTLISGQPFSSNPSTVIKEGINRSGVLGWIEEGNTFASKFTSGGIDIHRLYGANKPVSRFVNRNAAEMFLGPTYGKLQNLARTAGATARAAGVAPTKPGEKPWNESDTHALRMAVMGSNLPYLPRMFDQVEKGFNNAFGIQMKPKP